MARRLLALWPLAALAAEPTAFQQELLQQTRSSAASRSAGAAGDLVRRLGSDDVQKELRKCSPEAAKLEPEALAERLRQEVRAAEVISGFDLPGWPLGLMLEQAVSGPQHLRAQWEIGLEEGYNFSSTARDIKFGNQSAKQMFGMADDIERGVYGLRPFKKRGVPESPEEVAERPPYHIVNLFKLDSGSQLYGDISLVLSSSLAAESSIVSTVDTGSWSFLCNTTSPAFQRAFKVNCSAAGRVPVLGTLQDFDHLFLANEAYWNASIAKVACRLLAPWGSYPVRGPDLVHYWEAMPLSQLPFPSSVKFVLAAFDSLFGSERGALLQRWCARLGWVLVWSLGLNVGPAPHFLLAANLTWPMASNRRLADPIVLANTTAAHSLPLAEASRDFRSRWTTAEKLRREAKSAGHVVGNATWATAWSNLAQVLPASLHLAPIATGGAAACRDHCVGSAADGSCLCYAANELVV